PASFAAIRIARCGEDGNTFRHHTPVRWIPPYCLFPSAPVFSCAHRQAAVAKTKGPAFWPGLSRGVVAGSERRAWDSNPQPVSRHLISSQAAHHSLTLRTLLQKSYLSLCSMATGVDEVDSL